MNIALFYHSVISDWNHGNAHFLRGIATELQSRGHRVALYEPRNSWSLTNLIHDHGLAPVRRFRRAYPTLRARRYDAGVIDLDRELEGADLVIVHEWNDAALVNTIGEHRKAGAGYKLLFHDTHHRAVSSPECIAGFDLSGYDGVLAFGENLRRRYIKNGWCDRVWTWHEAADIGVFRPLAPDRHEGDLVWIGNWGDGERSEELDEFLLEPVRGCGLAACVYGVRYPPQALDAIRRAGVDFGGWLPNYEVPRVYSRFTATVHIPRKPYTDQLAGIPTIRVFEACACGIALVSAPWEDVEGLFSPGEDFLVAADGEEMAYLLRKLCRNPDLRGRLSRHGRETIVKRHTCGHRVDELLSIVNELDKLRSSARSRFAAAGGDR
jgi:spore maturation protein CgeB